MQKAKFQRLPIDTKKASREYRKNNKDVQEIMTAKSNTDHMPGMAYVQKNKGRES